MLTQIENSQHLQEQLESIRQREESADLAKKEAQRQARFATKDMERITTAERSSYETKVEALLLKHEKQINSGLFIPKSLQR